MKVFSFFLGLILLIGIIFNYHLIKGNIPKSYIPWELVDLTQPASFFTEYKLGRLKHDYAMCQTVLDNAGIKYTATGDKNAGSCFLTDQVTIQQSRYPYSAGVQSQCALAAALVLWENTVVHPLAEKYFNTDISRITHYGIFSCRNVKGTQRLSHHATANAIDIAAFTLKDGQTVSVLNDWGANNKKGQFLQDVFTQSCGIFKGALGPNYNAAHKNHFHFDLGTWNICR